MLYLSGKWKKLERILTWDMTTYLQTWRPKLSHAKTVTVAFHLNSQITSVNSRYKTTIRAIRSYSSAQSQTIFVMESN